jgi:hypothetical protein
MLRVARAADGEPFDVAQGLRQQAAHATPRIIAGYNFTQPL